MDQGIECVANNWPAIWDMVVYPQTNELYVSGEFTKDGYGNDLDYVARWDNQNEKWETTDSTFSFRFTHSLFTYNNNLFIPSSYEYLSSDSVIRKMIVLDNGIWNSIYNSTSEGRVFGSKVIDDKVYLVGSFHKVSDINTSGFAIFDGENFVELFDPEVYNSTMMLNDVVKWRDNIIVGGKGFYSYTEDYQGVVKVEDGAFHQIHNEFTVSATAQGAFVVALDVYQDNLIIGGEFNQYHGYTSKHIQSFDGEEMSSLGGMAPNKRVWDTEVYNGELYVVGDFTSIVDLPGGELNQSIPARGVAKWDGENWHSLNDIDLTKSDYDVASGMVCSILFHQDTMYVGGNFCSRGGDTAYSNIMRAPVPKREVIDVLEDYNLYPNPAHENFTLSFENPLGQEATVLLYNQLGQLVYETNIPKWGKKVEIKTSQYAQGVYTVTAKMGEHQLSKKVLVY